jgi:hypothetical protein
MVSEQSTARFRAVGRHLAVLEYSDSLPKSAFWVAVSLLAPLGKAILILQVA